MHASRPTCPAEGLAYPDIKTKVNIILCAASWAQMVLILLVFVIHRSFLERGEHRNLLAVAISSPFILVRLLYAFFVWSLHNPTFNMIGGNVTVQLVMAVWKSLLSLFSVLLSG